MQSHTVSLMINRARVGFQQFIDGFYKQLSLTKQQNRVHQIKRLIYSRQNQLLLHQYVEDEQIHLNGTIRKSASNMK